MLVLLVRQMILMVQVQTSLMILIVIWSGLRVQAQVVERVCGLRLDLEMAQVHK